MSTYKPSGWSNVTRTDTSERVRTYHVTPSWSTVRVMACVGSALATVLFVVLSLAMSERITERPAGTTTTVPVVLIPPVSVTRGGGS